MNFRKLFTEEDIKQHDLKKDNKHIKEEKESINNSNSFDANDINFREWADFFHQNGYIIINNAINKQDRDIIKADLQKENIKNNKNNKNNKKYDATKHVVNKCFFENSKKTVELVESSILYDFAQYLIADVPGNRGNTLKAHLIHNNAFTVPPNGRGQAASFHTDDCLQNVIIPEGKKLPDWIKLPVMLVTWMCWLSDCDTPNKGPTYVVPGSHRFGRIVDRELAEQLAIPACGKAGTCVLINNQLWHRGCQNTSDVPRETLQLTFARRIIGHKHKSIMNYNMPKHVYENKKEETKERLGFLQGGAYS
jgi:ectoine hydroxylase-related dioxygenase (phytanoyl-CoA dioxygenase family)